MTNEFLVKSREILLLDESDFMAHGGEGIQFGHLDGEIVRLRATGTAASIGHLARIIAIHRTAAR